MTATSDSNPRQGVENRSTGGDAEGHPSAPAHEDSRASNPLSAETRRRHRVRGIVQGVGFRPFVYRVARELGLTGFVLNDSGGVTIEVEGLARAAERFERALRAQPPPLARIDAVESGTIAPVGSDSFEIIHSEASPEQRTLVSPDVATCDDCLRELLDPGDRRYGYAFTNCTNCGPRLTIVEDVPYDREKTTMRGFAMCPDCRAEYRDPLDRRFHAQPNACPACGPRLTLLDARGVVQPEPVASAARWLARGAIVAVKGLGGYHLACDALDAAAVARLRARKRRDARPFALMVPDLETARSLCHVSEDEAALLSSRRRPIVILDRRADSPVAVGVAPGVRTLGLMLPYTPLHHLLLREVGATRDGGRPAVLVMTSGNISDEPILYRDDEARARLAGIADGWLTHDREIHTRVDDSLARVVVGAPLLLRRARGYAPEPITIEPGFPLPLLATGGHLKNTFCLGRDGQAFVSHHIGDLENLETLSSFREGIAHLERLFDIRPEAVAHDLHPDYLATRYALELDVPRRIGVQHHHAHVASVMAEYGLEGPLIGVAADGTGYGSDGSVWGGEILVATRSGFERLAHLATVPLPGGERAIREPWRMGAVYLHRAFGDDFLSLPVPFVERLADRPWPTLARMIARALNSPQSSSLGRLFDAVAAILGLRDEVDYEGQAAIELEAIAIPTDEAYPFEIDDARPAVIDPRATIRALAGDLERGVVPGVIAGRFHRTVAAMLVAGCRRVRNETGLVEVALSGGVFQNRLLVETIVPLLEMEGFTPYLNRQVPPNDGGLSLGQAVVAAARLREMGG